MIGLYIFLEMNQTYCIYFFQKLNLKNSKIATKIVSNNKKKLQKLQGYHICLYYPSYFLKRTFTRCNKTEIFKFSIAN